MCADWCNWRWTYGTAVSPGRLPKLRPGRAVHARPCLWRRRSTGLWCQYGKKRLKECFQVRSQHLL